MGAFGSVFGFGCTVFFAGGLSRRFTSPPLNRRSGRVGFGGLSSVAALLCSVDNRMGKRRRCIKIDNEPVTSQMRFAPDASLSTEDERRC